jgi:hypothetical protein
MRIRNVLMALVAVAVTAGAVTLSAPAHADEQVIKIEVEDRGDDLTLNEVKQLIEKRVQADVGQPTRAIVVDGGDLGGTPLPAAALDVLYSGKDAGKYKLLATVSRPALSATLAELKKAGGGSTVSIINSEWETSRGTSGVSRMRPRPNRAEIITMCQEGFGCVRIVVWTPGSFLP